jgi:hypothetical protein
MTHNNGNKINLQYRQFQDEAKAKIYPQFMCKYYRYYQVIHRSCLQ